jgi:hypothetical protein
LPSIDTLIAALRTNLDQVRDLITGIAASREQATDVRDQVGALGIQNSAAQAATTVDKLEEGQAQAAALSDKLEAALAAAEAARAGAGGKSRGGSGGDAPTTAPRSQGTRGYPQNLAHPTSWSDLFHICHGDENNMQKGGHLAGTGRPGKTEFPPDWDVDDVLEALVAVATHPEKADRHNSGNWAAKGVHRGVRLCVMVRPDGSIEAGWPESGPGVRTNPKPRR